VNDLKNMQKQYVITLLVTLIALIIIIVYSFNSFYSNIKKDTIALGESCLAQEVEQLNAYLDKGKDILQITAITVEYMIKEKASSKEILDFLTNEAERYKLNIDPNFTGIYGFINGEYLDGIGWVPDEDYVPQERVWYTDAVKAVGRPTIISPYLDAQTNSIMISISQLLYDKKSVVSLDIEMNEIQNITQNIHLNNYGYGFVCDKSGLVVAHSDINEKGKNYIENKEMSEILKKVYQEQDNNFEIDINDENFTIFSDTVMNDWYVVMVVNNRELYNDLRYLFIRNVIICTIIFVAIVIFCTLSLRRVCGYMAEIEANREKINNLNETIMKILARTIDAKDKYTKGHSVRVAEYSSQIAAKMGKSKKEQKEIYNVAMMHDVGKIGIPDSIINKTGKLTDEEYDLIKLHTLTGYHILKDISENKMIAIGAKFHHERYDGKGYPNGLKGEDIPLIARIIGVADAYDAMASSRSYRKALPQDVVRSEIENGKGKQFDPQIADIILEMIDDDKDYNMKQSADLNKTILVVDDDPITVNIVKNIFKSEPMYILIDAQKGQDALRIIDENNIDLIFLNVEMPDISGFEILKIIKGKYDIPVVFLTGHKNLDMMREAAELDVEDYLTKPFLPAALLEIANSVLND